MSVKELDAANPKFRGHLASGKWTLCVGAGLSRGIVPTWQELTRRLVNESFSTGYSEGDFQTLVSRNGWSLDSWIQACANHYRFEGRSLSDFFDLIEKNLYSDLRSRARGFDLEDVVVAVLSQPRSASRENVLRVCEFIESQYSTSSLIAVVRVLLRLLDEEKMPEAIISFNADTLLHTIIELYQRKDHYRGPVPHSHPRVRLLETSIVSPARLLQKALLPIYHCHGAIKSTISATREPRDSRDRLVFLESEYIRVATEASSWAETLFMFYAQTTRMVFLGFSMSDPNMRRWMALSNQSALHDLNAMTKLTDMTPRHIWLTTDPLEVALKTRYNEALSHLGVRPGWIRDWSQTEFALRNLLAL